MTETKVASGVVHRVPDDLRKMLRASQRLLLNWNNLTPLARNEWICWITTVKKHETRVKHLKQASSDILSGKKRPCCWPGCPHRK